MTRRSRRSKTRPEQTPRGAAAGPSRPAGATRPASADRRPSTSPAGTRRAGKRDRPVRRYDDRGFFERYRTPLLIAFTLAGIGLIGAFFVLSATRPTYACGTLMTPGPVQEGAASPGASPGVSPTAGTSPASPAASPPASPGASPSPGETPRLGFATTDMGREHLTRGGESKRYEHCPPTSGQHYNIQGQGPIRRNFYGPESERDPAGWIHNLEHGYVVALYSCGQNGQNCPSQQELDAVKRFYDTAPQTEGAVRCRVPNKILVARFDQMKTRFALVAWDRALLTDTFDVQQALRFSQQWIDGPSAPEAGGC